MNCDARTSRAVVMVIAVCVAALPAHAYVIDFDSEGLTGPQLAADTSAAPLTVSTPIGNVTFTGGAILTDEAALPADTSSVYYTSFFLTGGNQTITITFPTNILNFSVDLFNGETYNEEISVADNIGNTTTQTIGSNSASGNASIFFAAAGDVVTITTNDSGSYDFSIDNINFDFTPISVPEPTTLMLFGIALAGVTLARHRRA